MDVDTHIYTCDVCYERSFTFWMYVFLCYNDEISKKNNIFGIFHTHPLTCCQARDENAIKRRKAMDGPIGLHKIITYKINIYIYGTRYSKFSVNTSASVAVIFSLLKISTRYIHFIDSRDVNRLGFS